MKYVIVEHLEPCLSPWMLCEYEYLSKIFSGRTIYTNVKDGRAMEVLKKYGEVYSDEFTKAIKILNLRDVIVLDPKAEELLKRDELVQAEGVVVGGIMGDHPPKGRTSELITNKAKHLKSRNLGSKQLTIAGVAYVLKEMEGGKEFREIPIIEGVEIKVKVGMVDIALELPYAFPAKNGQPVLPDNYIDTVIKKSLIFEDSPCVNDVSDA